MKLKSILLSTSLAALAGSAGAQSIVTTGGQKYVLLEQGTGTWCGYCPDGSQRIQQTIYPTYPRCIAVAPHNSDGMALSPDTFNSTYISGSTAVPPGPGWPGATIDRVAWASPGVPGASGACGQNRGYWATDVGYQHALTPAFDVSMASTYDSATRLVTINVKGKALVAGTGQWRINAYIVEDSISSATYPQSSYMNASSGSWFMGKGSSLASDTIYAHMGVVRKVLASGGSIFGDTAFVNPAVGDSITKTYTYTIPASHQAKYTRVVGFVQKWGTATNARPIENTIYARVRLMAKTLPSTSVADITNGKMQDVEIFPNPAQNVIGVRGLLETPTATTVRILNAIGQVVLVKEFPAAGSMFGESIAIDNLSNGLYFLNITNEGSTVTREFSVVK